MELITVIVPVYKVEKYLNRCIDSIIAQTYKNLEIILVDDGSPDNCGKICDEYAGKDSRIKVIHQENGGLSAARNAGLDIATGEYIGFVDSDDYIAPDMYEKLYKALKLCNGSIALCNFQMVDEENNHIKTKARICNGVLSAMEALSELQGKNDGCYVIVCNKLFCAELFKNVRFPLGRLCEDNYIIHGLYYYCKNIVKIDSALYYYTQRDNSIMNSLNSKFLIDEAEGFISRYYFYKENRITELIVDCKKCLVGFYRRRYSIAFNNSEARLFIDKYDRFFKDIYNEIHLQCSLKDHLFYRTRLIYIALFKLKHLSEYLRRKKK